MLKLKLLMEDLIQLTGLLNDFYCLFEHRRELRKCEYEREREKRSELLALAHTITLFLVPERHKVATFLNIV